MPYDMKQELYKEVSFLLLHENRYMEIANSYFKKSDNLYELYPDLCSRITLYKPWLKGIKKQVIIYEGSQGLLLDGKYGLRPNTTHLDTTNHKACKDAKMSEKTLSKRSDEGTFDIRKIGIAKAFYSRHGEGVFPTECVELKESIIDENQEETYWNGKIRFGWFDAVLFRYAQSINKVNEIFMSSLDKLDGIPQIKVCNSYKYKGAIDEQFKKIFSYYHDEQGNVIILDIIHSCKNISRYLEECEPIYITVKGWEKAVSESNKGHKKTMSYECRNYLQLISSLIKIPITCISYGPTKNEKMAIQ